MEGDVGGGLVYSVAEHPASVEMNPTFPPTDNPPDYQDEPIIMNGSTWNDTLACWWDPVDNATICSPMDIDMYSMGFKVAIAILYNSIFVTALLGNALVCYVVFSSPRMRTVTNYLIANLAVGDLLMAVLCVPFSYIPILLQYWPFGNFLCYLLSPAQAITVLVSSYTLVALAADRYMAILYPLRPRFRRSQACWVIVVVWLIAIITASPIAIFTEYFQDNATGRYYCDESGWKRMGVEEFKLPYSLTLMILQYFFPLTVLIFTYSRIAMAVWGKKSLGEAEDSRDQRLAKTKRKMIKMMLTVVFVYTLSWLPINIFLVYGDIWDENLYLENRETVSFIYPVIHWLAMAHSVWNPIIYCYMNSRFREGFKAAVSNVPCVWKLSRCCQLPGTRRAANRSSCTGLMTDSVRRRVSYYYSQSGLGGNNRLTRTNTTCTTYTFGSGSLHNIHNPAAGAIYQHHNYALNNSLMMGRKQSYLFNNQGKNGSINNMSASRNGSKPSIGSSNSILVSQYPKPNHLHLACSSVPLGSARPQDMMMMVGNGGQQLKESSTLTSLAPGTGQSSSQETSPSSPSDAAAAANSIALSGIKKNSSYDLNSNYSNGGRNVEQNGKKNGSLQKKVVSNGSGNAKSVVIRNSSSYVTLAGKGGKEVVTTTAVEKGKSKSTSGESTPSSTTSGSLKGVSSKVAFLGRKRSSNSSGISESFM